MLDAANILIDRQPVAGDGAVERAVAGLACETDEIPAGIDERVERVGLAGRGAAAGRAGDMLPARMAVERVARHVEGHVLRQHHRQLVIRHRHGAAGRAVNDRDRRAPVTLARDAPVAKPPGDGAFAPPFRLGAGDDRRLGVIDAHAVEKAGIDQDAIAALRFAFDRRGGEIGACGNHASDRQSVFGGELEIALVVARDAEDGAGAIVHQDEVGDVDRQLPGGIERVADRRGRCRSPSSPPSRARPRWCRRACIRR